MGAFKIAKTVLKSAFRKPATLMYPVVEREWQERTRGSIDIDADKCILCGICAKRCPADAINVDRNGGKWEIHRMQCVQCGECVESCPKKCLEMNPKYTEPSPEKVVDAVDVEIKKPAGKAGGDSASAGGDGDLTCNRDVCIYCGLCAKACPADALKVDRKEKIWEVDKEACVKCGACVDKCPKKCLSFGENEEKAEGDSAAAAAAADAGADEEKLVCDLDTCIYCGLCAKNCPCDALEVDRKEKTWKVDEEACVKCGACVDKCPKKCLSIGATSAGEEKDGADKETEAEAAETAEEKTEDKPQAKSVPEVDEDRCVYCSMCANECPSDALTVEIDSWKIDEDECIGCAACVDVCPADALKMTEK